MLKSTCFLVVDDFSSIRRLISDLLRELGCNKILEAEDGEKALLMLRSGDKSMPHIDFVITDWNMPRMDGLALLQAIRRDDRVSDIPVLVVTAETRKENIFAAAKAGADGYIVKPFNAATLEERLGKILIRKGLSVCMI